MSEREMVMEGHLGGYIHGGAAETWCPHLWSWAIEEFQVRSMMDVGCGEGQSAKYFLDVGCEVTGVEGCPRAIANSAIPNNIRQHDFCDGPFFAGGTMRLDLVL